MRVPISKLAIVLAITLSCLAPRITVAHDIPSEVTVQALIKPSGGHLDLLVRVPFKALRDIEFPLHGPGYLDLERAEPFLRDAAHLWILDAIEIYENGARLPEPEIGQTRVSLESDRSFSSYESAFANIQSNRLPNGTEVYWNQAVLDAHFEYPIRSDRASFSIHPGLARLGERVVTVIRFLPPTGGVRAFELTGDPGVVILDPRWQHAAFRFVQSGFLHILTGTDHLLFLCCLVIPLRRFRSLIAAVTSFTLAHSLTLIACVFGIVPSVLWFPPLIETLIALSILYMAIENIIGRDNFQRRWIVAFGFGLVHGFGFSFALRESLQFAGTHLITSLLSFNFGVEVGQLLLLLLLMPALGVFFKLASTERWGVILLSALLGHTAWHWMTERAYHLAQFRPELPELTSALLADVLRWFMLIVISVGLVWCIRRLWPQTFSLQADPGTPSNLPIQKVFASRNRLQPDNGGGEL